MTSWEAVIGLEIHVQLNTKSKLFSSAPNRFGDEPNTNITEVCTGQPGSLPILNKEAVRKAVQFGCAIGADVSRRSRFDRKSYFYPDSPRNFQITQFYMPIITGGRVITDVEGVCKEFAIKEAHLEDDAGMLKHFSTFAGVDYNRAGAPLLEIVSEPCLHSGKEAACYAKAIRAIMQYIGASDCNMEEGSLRVDANISVRPIGEKTLRPKIEVKNMNSFNFLEMAIDAEIKRQVRLYEKHPGKAPEDVVETATYRWDPERKETVVMRKKEGAHDYRYVPEPDLPPITISQEMIDEVMRALPELPYQKLKRYVGELGLSEYAAGVLTADKEVTDYFEEGMARCHDAKRLCNWITIEFAGRLKDKGISLRQAGIKPCDVADLVLLIAEGKVTGPVAKKMADEMLAKPGVSPKEILQDNPDYRATHSEEEISGIVNKVLEENEPSIQAFLGGKNQAFGYLVGQVMKASAGTASPKIANELLRARLEKLRGERG